MPLLLLTYYQDQISNVQWESCNFPTKDITLRASQPRKLRVLSMTHMKKQKLREVKSLS